jgi:acyl-CoA thioesterase
VEGLRVEGGQADGPQVEGGQAKGAHALGAQALAERAAKALLNGDTASALLGIRLLQVKPGYALVAMTIRPDMVNGHSLCHGGFIFTLADTAFAVSCNSHNESTVAAAASIDFLAPGSVGDELTAEANEVWRSGRSGIYEITVTNQRGERIALFRGRSHRISGQVTSA